MVMNLQPPIPPVTPQVLLEYILAERARLAALWDGLTFEEMTQRPGPQLDWSVKDLIAHITWYEEDGMALIDALLRGDEPNWIDDVDETNAETFRRNEFRSLEEVLTDFDAVPHKLEAQLSRISERELNDASLFPQGRGESILDYYVGNTYGHYDDHYDDLKRYVESLKPHPPTRSPN
jgi:hypothetical protein